MPAASLRSRPNQLEVLAFANAAVCAPGPGQGADTVNFGLLFAGAPCQSRQAKKQ
jgi:hypothetical protein